MASETRINWERKYFAIPSGVLPVICSTLFAHPWAFGVGQKQETGFYLSPENAIKYLAEKLNQAESDHDVLVMMLTANSLPEFITELAKAAVSFPIPELTQVSRKAKSYLELANTKMQLPATPGGLPAQVPLSISTTRSASAAESLQKAMESTLGGHSPAALDGLMTQFKAARSEAKEQAAKQLEQLQGVGFSVWVHSTEKNSLLAKSELLKDIPDDKAIFTLAMMFIGQDLKSLRNMVKRDDNRNDKSN
ncbi:hypothetical protein AB7X03_14160 [Providencia rettgeri]